MSTKKSKLLESAQKNIQKGLLERAIKEYEEIVNLDPADIRHRQKLAELLAKANRRDEAIKEYNSLAKHYEESVHYVKAIAVYKQIQKLDPANPEVSLTLAALNVKQGLIGNAIAEYNSALQVYENNKENRKALKVLESLLSLDSKNAAIRLRIADKYFTVGEETQALELFAELARDLKEIDDENGYSRVAERMLDLFPEKAAILLADMEEVPEPEPPAFVSIIETAPSAPELIPPPSPAPPIEEEEVEPVSQPGAISYEAEDEIELIEEIIEIEELAEEKEESAPVVHEWEEEIDLDSMDVHDFGVTTAVEESLQTEEAVGLAEFELEEIELELEIEPEEIELEELDLEEVELELEVEQEEVELEELVSGEIELDLGVEPVPFSAGAASEEPLPFAETASDSFDLAGELALFADELDFNLPQRDSGDETFAADSSEMFKTSDLDREDAESHYSLGLAYKEMGLYEEAIGEFEVAANSPARRIDSLLLQGLCHRDSGELSEAKKILTSLLQEPSISENELLSVKYELATCHEISGETESARRLFTEIVTIRPGFSDAASRLENL